MATGAEEPADLSQWKIAQAGDVETNPGPHRYSKKEYAYERKRTTVRKRETPNLLMGDSLIKDIRNELWNIRAIHGGIPIDLRDWVHDKPDIVRRMDNVVILAGGNAVCTRPDSNKTPTSPESTAKQIFSLVWKLRREGVGTVRVLGIPKRRNEEDMRKRNPETSGSENPKRRKKEACKTGQNSNISRLNDILRSNERKEGYRFVGMGDIAARDCFQDDGVHLSEKGVCALANILRRSCL